MDNEQHDVRQFIVPGTPIGKGRPRACRMGNAGRVHMYTPARTQAYEAMVRGNYRAKYAGRQAMEGAIKATIIARFAIPKSASKREAARLLTSYYTRKSDADNVAKIVLDALNGVAFADDRQVAVLEVVKVYAVEARVEVVLDALEDSWETT